MQYNHNNHSQRGLTLVEMLVIAPFVMLFIGALIFLLVQLSGNSLASKEQATTAYNTQDALDNMEQDAYYATAFPASITPLSSPQGSDNSTTQAFNTLTLGGNLSTEAYGFIIQVPAISTSPFNPSRRLIYSQTPSATNCNSSAENTNDIYPVYYVYYVNNNVLYRRTLLGDSTHSASGWCSPSAYGSPYMPWQVNSCAQGATINGSPCSAYDQTLLNNVTNFTVSYFDSNGVATAPGLGTKISVTLGTSTTIAGKNVNYSATRYMTSSNLQ